MSAASSEYRLVPALALCICIGAHVIAYRSLLQFTQLGLWYFNQSFNTVYCKRVYLPSVCEHSAVGCIPNQTRNTGVPCIHLFIYVQLWELIPIVCECNCMHSKCRRTVHPLDTSCRVRQCSPHGFRQIDTFGYTKNATGTQSLSSFDPIHTSCWLNLVHWIRDSDKVSINVSVNTSLGWSYIATHPYNMAFHHAVRVVTAHSLYTRWSA